MPALLKAVHVTCAGLSFTGFVLRGVLMLRDSPRRRLPVVRVLPHVVDTLLLVSAVGLAAQLHVSPLRAPWLAAKLIALVCYIGLGFVALRFGPDRRVRATAWVLALATFAYIVAVAATHSPLPWSAATATR